MRISDWSSDVCSSDLICPDLSGQCPHRSRVIAIGNSGQLMRILLTSPMGDPLDSKTWSSAPSNLARALIAKGVDIVPFDSRVVGKSGKAIAAAWNLVRGQIGRAHV